MNKSEVSRSRIAGGARGTASPTSHWVGGQLRTAFRRCLKDFKIQKNSWLLSSARSLFTFVQWGLRGKSLGGVSLKPPAKCACSQWQLGVDMALLSNHMLTHQYVCSLVCVCGGPTVCSCMCARLVGSYIIHVFILAHSVMRVQEYALT